jgi:hypothetical protein
MNFRVINLNEQNEMKRRLGACYYKTKKEAIAKAKELGWNWQKNMCGKWFNWDEKRKGYFE